MSLAASEWAWLPRPAWQERRVRQVSEALGRETSEEGEAIVDNGTEYAELALRVAEHANAEFVEPIRLALLAVSEQRNDHWRAYIEKTHGASRA